MYNARCLLMLFVDMEGRSAETLFRLSSPTSVKPLQTDLGALGRYSKVILTRILTGIAFSFGAVPRFPRRRCECYRTIISNGVTLMRLAVDACYQ